jgi:hypothetical protein
MQHGPGLSAHIPIVPPFDELTDADILLATRRAASAPLGTDPDVYTNDAMAAMQMKICAEAFGRACDGMGKSVAEANIDYVCDQLEKVQEAAGRAILAMLNCRRESIIDTHLGDDDDDEDLPDTVTLPMNATPPDGGAA